MNFRKLGLVVLFGFIVSLSYAQKSDMFFFTINGLTDGMPKFDNQSFTSVSYSVIDGEETDVDTSMVVDGELKKFQIYSSQAVSFVGNTIIDSMDINGGSYVQQTAFEGGLPTETTQIYDDEALAMMNSKTMFRFDNESRLTKLDKITLMSNDTMNVFEIAYHEDGFHSYAEVNVGMKMSVIRQNIGDTIRYNIEIGFDESMLAMVRAEQPELTDEEIKKMLADMLGGEEEGYEEVIKKADGTFLVSSVDVKDGVKNTENVLVLDKNLNILSEETYYNGELAERNEYTYTSDNQILTIKNNSGEIITNTYNDNNQPLRYSSTGIDLIVYTYDDENRVSTEISYTYIDGEVGIVKLYKY